MKAADGIMCISSTPFVISHLPILLSVNLIRPILQTLKTAFEARRKKKRPRPFNSFPGFVDHFKFHWKRSIGKEAAEGLTNQLQDENVGSLVLSQLVLIKGLGCLLQ